MRNLELHVSHACNLACESCSHYSNHNLKGSVTLEEADEWMSLWNDKVAPKQFSLLGGEPTINPQLLDIIRLTRRKWKYSKILLVTNGFLLHRHPDLPKVLKEVGNVILSISVHHSSEAYTEKITPNLALAEDWKKKYKLDIEVRPSAKYWTRRYKGYGPNMQPFEDNNPRASWEGCFAKYCTQLFEGKLWKCPPLAYLRMQDEKFKLSEKWINYLNYKALPPDCTKQELVAFTSEEEIAECSMCAANLEHFELPNPLIRPSLKASAVNS
ncbi:radical SAM family protein [Arachidicoccus ginsenosidimutans]|nr:radical SAM family protein [Arachidicoccus sp. BS20]